MKKSHITLITILIFILTLITSPALINILENHILKDPLSAESSLRIYFLFFFSLTTLLLIYLNIKEIKIKNKIIHYNLIIFSLILIGIWIIDQNNIFKSEASSLTFFSAVILFICSFIALINFFLYKNIKRIKLSILWLIITLAFLLASLDEFFLIHERMGGLISKFTLTIGPISAQDFTTFLYAIAGLIFVFIFIKLAYKEYVAKEKYFYKLLIIGIVIYAISSIFIDTFDYLFLFLNRFFDTIFVLNSIEEILEFLAANLFLSAFIINILEIKEYNFLKNIKLKNIKKSIIHKFFLILSILIVILSLLITIIYYPQQQPIIYEDYPISVFASDELKSVDTLLYDKRIGLIFGDEKATKILVFDLDGNSRIFADESTGLDSAEAIVISPDNFIYVTDDHNKQILKYDFNGNAEIFLDKNLISPEALAIDKNGIIYFADEGSSIIVKYDKKPTVVASSINGIRAIEEMIFDNENNLYATDDSTGNVFKITPDKVEIIASFSNAEGITIGPDNNIYVSDSQEGIIYRIDAQNKIKKIITFSKKYTNLQGLTFDENRNLYIGLRTIDNRPYIFKIQNVAE